MTESAFEKKRNWWTTPVYAAAREGKVFYEHFMPVEMGK
jgi:hypothetical protein